MRAHILKKRTIAILFFFMAGMLLNFYALFVYDSFVYYVCGMYVLSAMASLGDFDLNMSMVTLCQVFATFFAWIPDDETSPGFVMFDRLLTALAVVSYYSTFNYGPPHPQQEHPTTSETTPDVTLGEVVGFEAPQEETLGLPIYEMHTPPPYPPPPAPSAPIARGGEFGTDPLYRNMGSNQIEEKMPC
jgi:hypothetical protein